LERSKKESVSLIIKKFSSSNKGDGMDDILERHLKRFCFEELNYTGSEPMYYFDDEIEEFALEISNENGEEFTIGCFLDQEENGDFALEVYSYIFDLPDNVDYAKFYKRLLEINSEFIGAWISADEDGIFTCSNRWIYKESFSSEAGYNEFSDMMYAVISILDTAVPEIMKDFF